MKKTLGQVLFENQKKIQYIPFEWDNIKDKTAWERLALQLSRDFDTVARNTTCNDEQTDDSSGVPVNVDTLD